MGESGGERGSGVLVAEAEAGVEADKGAETGTVCCRESEDPRGRGKGRGGVGSGRLAYLSSSSIECRTSGEESARNQDCDAGTVEERSLTSPFVLLASPGVPPAAGVVGLTVSSTERTNSFLDLLLLLLLLLTRSEPDRRYLFTEAKRLEREFECECECECECE